MEGASKCKADYLGRLGNRLDLLGLHDNYIVKPSKFLTYNGCRIVTT